MMVLSACAQEEGIKVELSRDLDYDGVCEALFQQLKGAVSSQPCRGENSMPFSTTHPGFVNGKKCLLPLCLKADKGSSHSQS